MTYTPQMFEDELMALIDKAVTNEVSVNAIVSALELRLMAFEEEADDE